MKKAQVKFLAAASLCLCFLQPAQAFADTQTNQQNAQQTANHNNQQTTSQQIPDGWKTESGHRYYYRNQQKLTGWQTIDGKKYYFAADGSLASGWQTINGKKYYFAADGSLATGWQTINGKKYYFAANGSLATGWQTINGKKYYFAADGRLLTGPQKIGKSRYLLSKSGQLQFGLHKYGSYWYLSDKNGRLKTGLQKINKNSYSYFSPSTGRKLFKNAAVKKVNYLISKKTGTVTGIKMKAAAIGQRPLVTGCEIVAATMMLNYAGKKISKYQAAAATPHSSNPRLGFIGNPYSWSGTWIAPSGLARMVRKYLRSCTILSGSSLATLKSRLLTKQHPIVVWVSWVDGFPNHALLLTGYNGSRIYYNDPWTGRASSMTTSNFWYHYSTLHWAGGHQRALSY